MAALLADQPLERYTETTPTGVDEVLAHLDLVRARGYDVCDDELDRDVWAVAAPVHGIDLTVRASVTMAAPAAHLPGRVDRDHARSVVLATAARVSEELGYRPDEARLEAAAPDRGSTIEGAHPDTTWTTGAGYPEPSSLDPDGTDERGIAMTLRVSGYGAFAEPLLTQPDAVRRAELARDIVSAAYLRGDFVLSSGARSGFYFDKYLFETKPTILRRIASLLAERVPANVDRLAGPELGAVALAAALSLETGLPFVIVRKTSKEYATTNLVEGELHAGERVLIIEDVISTAAQAVRAAQQVTQASAEVAGILGVIDREQGGSANITAAGYHFDALFRLSELNI